MEDNSDDETQAVLYLTPAEEKKFIELVHKHPYLYDMSHPKYRDIGVKEHAWQEIGIEMKLPYLTCKNRWRSIRDTYKRAKKRKEANKRSKDHPKCKLKFYSKLLSFLDELPQETDKSTEKENNDVELIVEHVKSELEDSSNDNSVDESSTTIHQTRKRKTEQNNAQYEFESIPSSSSVEDAEIDTFTMYIKSVYKKMPRILQIKAKKEMFEVLAKYEIASILQQESDPLNNQQYQQ